MTNKTEEAGSRNKRKLAVLANNDLRFEITKPQPRFLHPVVVFWDFKKQLKNFKNEKITFYCGTIG